MSSPSTQSGLEKPSGSTQNQQNPVANGIATFERLLVSPDPDKVKRERGTDDDATAPGLVRVKKESKSPLPPDDDDELVQAAGGMEVAPEDAAGGGIGISGEDFHRENGGRRRNTLTASLTEIEYVNSEKEIINRFKTNGDSEEMIKKMVLELSRMKKNARQGGPPLSASHCLEVRTLCYSQKFNFFVTEIDMSDQVSKDVSAMLKGTNNNRISKTQYMLSRRTKDFTPLESKLILGSLFSCCDSSGICFTLVNGAVQRGLMRSLEVGGSLSQGWKFVVTENLNKEYRRRKFGAGVVIRQYIGEHTALLDYITPGFSSLALEILPLKNWVHKESALACLCSSSVGLSMFGHMFATASLQNVPSFCKTRALQLVDLDPTTSVLCRYESIKQELTKEVGQKIDQLVTKLEEMEPNKKKKSTQTSQKINIIFTFCGLKLPPHALTVESAASMIVEHTLKELLFCYLPPLPGLAGLASLKYQPQDTAFKLSEQQQNLIHCHTDRASFADKNGNSFFFPPDLLRWITLYDDFLARVSIHSTASAVLRESAKFAGLKATRDAFKAEWSAYLVIVDEKDSIVKTEITGVIENSLTMEQLKKNLANLKENILFRFIDDNTCSTVLTQVQKICTGSLTHKPHHLLMSNKTQMLTLMEVDTNDLFAELLELEKQGCDADQGQMKKLKNMKHFMPLEFGSRLDALDLTVIQNGVMVQAVASENGANLREVMEIQEEGQNANLDDNEEVGNMLALLRRGNQA